MSTQVLRFWYADGRSRIRLIDAAMRSNNDDATMSPLPILLGPDPISTSRRWRLRHTPATGSHRQPVADLSTAHSGRGRHEDGGTFRDGRSRRRLRPATSAATVPAPSTLAANTNGHEVGADPNAPSAAYTRVPGTIPTAVAAR